MGNIGRVFHGGHGSSTSVDLSILRSVLPLWTLALEHYKEKHSGTTVDLAAAQCNCKQSTQEVKFQKYRTVEVQRHLVHLGAKNTHSPLVLIPLE